MGETHDRGALWTRMRFLLDALTRRPESEAFVDECLDLLADLVGAELATVFTAVGEEQWHPIATRVNRRPAPPPVLLAPVAAILSEARRAKHCVVTAASQGIFEHGPARMVAVPLRQGAWRNPTGGHRHIGVIYLETPPDSNEIDRLTVEFLDAAAVLLAVTLDQQARLEAIREEMRAERALDSIDDGPSLDQMLSSSSLTELRPDVEACVVGESSVMILGESGTGKTRLATAIAKASSRTPIVRATLGASDDLNTITSELFGHERGAFSGAVTARKGLVEYADGGTLILDEVLNLPPHAQQLLLDFTQFGTYRPLGYQGENPKHSRTRIITATNGNIRQAIVDTRFRQDLYFRLAGVTITLPPLRERRGDVPELAQDYLRRLDPVGNWKLSASARRLLLSEAWEWEGNVRQLQGVMRQARDRAVATGVTGGALDAKHIGRPARIGAPKTHTSSPPTPWPGTAAPEPSEPSEEELTAEERWATLQARRSKLDEVERDVIEQAMIENRGVVAHAARQLCVSRTSLLSRMATLQIDRKKYKR